MRGIVDKHICRTRFGHLGSVILDTHSLCHRIGFAAENHPAGTVFNRSATFAEKAAEQAASHSQSLTHQHTEFDERINHCAEAREVLAVEDEHRLVEHLHIAHRVFFGAFALVVEHVHRQVPVLVALFHHAVGEVDVFAIHEEIFVKPTYLLKQIGAAEHVGTSQNVDGVGLKLVEIAKVVFSESP